MAAPRNPQQKHIMSRELIATKIDSSSRGFLVGQSLTTDYGRAGFDPSMVIVVYNGTRPLEIYGEFPLGEIRVQTGIISKEEG